MSKLAPEIIAALIAAIITLIVAVISLYSNRSSERKKLKDLIRGQEFQNRINALHSAIEIIQKIKDELRYIADGMNRSSKLDLMESVKSIKDSQKAFSDNYSSSLGSLHDEERRLLHEVAPILLDVLRFVEELTSNKGNRSSFIPKNQQEILNHREQLSEIQEQYRKLRRKIINEEEL
jgi:vacuolar-type H+-ATPase subunit I/STV1